MEALVYKKTFTYVENFKACNIEYTNKVLSFLFSIQSFVNSFDHPFEETVVHSFCQSTNRIADLLLLKLLLLLYNCFIYYATILYLILISSLSYKLITDSDSWFAQILVKVSRISAEKMGNTFTLFHAIRFALLFSGSLLEFQASDVHNNSSNFIDILFLFFSKTQYIKSILIEFVNNAIFI